MLVKQSWCCWPKATLRYSVVAIFVFLLLTSLHDSISFLHGGPQIQCFRVRCPEDAGILRLSILELTGSISKSLYGWPQGNRGLGLNFVVIIGVIV